MYAYLRGTLAVRGRDFVALDCGGVGYKIFVTEGYLQACKIGEEATLYTHLVVREEELSLYGFSSEAEKEMFEKLIGVSGVGPKAGRAILSEMPAREVAAAIFSADARAFSKVSGIGPKTAGKIVLELKDKIKAQAVVLSKEEDTAVNTAVGDAIAALVSLGYAKAEATSAVSDVSSLADTAEELILLAIQRIG